MVALRKITLSHIDLSIEAVKARKSRYICCSAIDNKRE